MSLAAGVRLGPYELVALIGAGGMGEVYRAYDTRLRREVAVKVIGSAFAGVPDRLRRFEQEARAAAALDHPNILAVHDIGCVALSPAGGPPYDVHFIVSELLEGRTLRDRLQSGRMPPRDAVACAIQIAHGLAAAHDKGIVHRDLKPDNIFLTADDRPKILDFGLAKLTDVDPRPISDAGSLTADVSTPVFSDAGRVMGTVGYMSPEQVRGLPADPRSDIFALGIVLFEMLVGRNPFVRDTAPETLTAVLKEEIAEIHLTDSTLSPVLDRIVRRCLAKASGQRFQSARDLAFALETMTIGGTDAAVAAPPAGLVSRLSRGLVPWAVAGVLAIALGLVAQRSPSAPAGRDALMRFTVKLPPDAPLDLGLGGSLAVAPDGSQLVYVARTARGSQLYVRRLDDSVARPIPGGEDAEFPFFSPDGAWVGFFSIAGPAASRLAGLALKKVPPSGGAPTTIAEAPAFVGGASWGQDGTVFVGGPGISRVPASGGTLERFATAPKGIVAYATPQALPRALLFTIRPDNVTTFDDARIAVQRFDDQKPKIVIEGGGFAQYAPSGHIVYARGDSIWAVPFDANRLEVTGQPVAVAKGGMFDTVSARANFGFSQTGVLIYVPGGPVPYNYTLHWIDRRGRSEPIPVPAKYYRQPSFSPDAAFVAMGIGAANDDVWLYDFARGVFTRVTFTGGDNRNPIWTPGGDRIVYAARRAGPENLFWRSADGTGAEERLTESQRVQTPGSWTPDGEILAFTEYRPQTRGDILTIRPKTDRTPRPFLATPFDENTPTFSPDGRWIAYVSDESGVSEVYVQPFEGSGRKTQVSIGGGTIPFWRRDGTELVYRDRDRLMAVSVALTPTLRLGQPQQLLTLPPGTLEVAMTPDGQRFLIVERDRDALVATELEVIVNWVQQVTKR